jgi:hypothetical protein
VQTPLIPRDGGCLEATIPMSGPGGKVNAKAINAVLRDKGNDKWYKSGQADFHVPLTADPAAASANFGEIFWDFNERELMQSCRPRGHLCTSFMLLCRAAGVLNFISNQC